MLLYNLGRRELTVGSRGEMGVGSSSKVQGKLHAETQDVRQSIPLSFRERILDAFSAEASEL